MGVSAGSRKIASLVIEGDDPFDRLLPRHQIFVVEFLKDLNASQASIRMGIEPRAAGGHGHNLLKRSDVQQAIAHRRKNIIDLSGLTIERILQEYMRLAFSSISRFTSVTDAGNDLFSDFSKATEDDFAAVAEVVSEVYTEGKGDDAERVKRTRIKLHDKRGALDSLSKIMGLMKTDDPEAAITNLLRAAMGGKLPGEGGPKRVTFERRLVKPVQEATVVE